MISQTAEYALRAIVFLAAHPDGSHNVHQIAEGTKSPEGYLSKILRELGRAGLVRSQRGLHGGFTLMRSPAQITVYDVVNAVDPVQRISSCPLGLGLHCRTLCTLHQRLDDSMAQIEREFRESTIAEILSTPSSSIPLVG